LMDRTGRFIGMAVFLLGVVVLLVVFGMAYGMFTTPASRLFGGNGGSSSVTAAQLGSAVAITLVRIGLLFVMTLAGSLVASRGIHIYLGSGKPLPSEAVEKSDEE
jgi:hypothetical protein